VKRFCVEIFLLSGLVGKMGENVKETEEDGPILNLTALKLLKNRNSIEMHLIPGPENFLRIEWSHKY